jgi:hypothetical protein
MSTFNSILSMLVVIVLSFSFLTAQDQVSDPSLPEGPRVYFDALNFSANQEKESKLDVYIEIPYEGLQFVKNNDIFRSA